MEDTLADPGLETWGPLWIYGLVLVLTGMASMIFAYFYFLLLNFSRAKLLQLANGSGYKEKLEGYLNHFDRILNTVVALEIISKVFFVLSLYVFVTGSFHMESLPGLIPTLILAGIWFIFFCRILPAEIGNVKEEEVLLHLLPTLYRFSVIMHPLLFPLLLFRQAIRNIARPSTPDEEAEHYAEEIMDAVEEGEREGVIPEHEADMIESIVELRNIEVSEIMTPRMDMYCVEQEMPIAEVLEKAIEIGHSRIPVYEENRDHIVGILYIKDLLEYWPNGEKEKPKLPKIMRKPFFIPETKKVSMLFSEFRENKIHMAIVLDEYGGTAGLVTNEDILEEIVGEIVDEHDKNEEVDFKELGTGCAEISGKLHIDELNEKMGIHLPESDDFDTIGGFIFTHLGKVPIKGDVLNYENVKLSVLDADDRRINRIGIKVLEEQN